MYNKIVIIIIIIIIIIMIIINNYWMRLFVISRIIKGQVSVITPSRRLRPMTLTETLIILDITKKKPTQ